MADQALTAWRVLTWQRSHGGQGLNSQRSSNRTCWALTLSWLCFRLMMKDRHYFLAVPWMSGLAGWSQDGWAQEVLWDGVNKQENQPHHRNGSSMFDHCCATGILCFQCLF